MGGTGTDAFETPDRLGVCLRGVVAGEDFVPVCGACLTDATIVVDIVEAGCLGGTAV